MVMGNSHFERSSAPFEYLSISSAKEHHGVADEDLSLHVPFPVKLKEELQKAQKSPFDDVWPNHACTCDTGNSFAFSPTSPINIPSHTQRGTWRSSPCTERESLLEDAWQRKQELYLKQELANFEECANRRMLGRSSSMLGRSSSDCGNQMMDIFQEAKYELLERSMSDCGKPKKDTLGIPNGLTRAHTRSLTDDDFEELKGCLDLGFRFDQSSIPDLCDIIPALEVVSAVNQNLQESLIASPVETSMPSPSSSWRITNPGDDPEEVREKLRHWAQAVACSARLCY